MTRDRREVLAAVGAVVMVVSTAFPWTYSLPHGLSLLYFPPYPQKGLHAAGWWPLVLGVLAFACVFVQRRRGVSTAWALVGIGSVGLWHLGGSLLDCRRFEGCGVGPGLVIAIVGGGVALVAGALGVREPDAELLSETEILEKGGRRVVKAVADFHEHRHDL